MYHFRNIMDLWNISGVFPVSTTKLPDLSVVNILNPSDLFVTVKNPELMD